MSDSQTATLPDRPPRSNLSVIKLSGICANMPLKAHTRNMCSGTEISNKSRSFTDPPKTNQIFVEKSRNEEDNNWCNGAWVTMVDDRFVEVSNRPAMNRNIPCAPKVVGRFGVPKVTKHWGVVFNLLTKHLQIKFAVTKAQNFSHQIRCRVKYCVETKQPKQMIRNGQLQETFHTML